MSYVRRSMGGPLDVVAQHAGLAKVQTTLVPTVDGEQRPKPNVSARWPWRWSPEAQAWVSHPHWATMKDRYLLEGWEWQPGQYSRFSCRGEATCRGRSESYRYHSPTGPQGQVGGYRFVPEGGFGPSWGSRIWSVPSSTARFYRVGPSRPTSDDGPQGKIVDASDSYITRKCENAGVPAHLVPICLAQVKERMAKEGLEVALAKVVAEITAAIASGQLPQVDPAVTAGQKRSRILIYGGLAAAGLAAALAFSKKKR